MVAQASKHSSVMPEFASQPGSERIISRGPYNAAIRKSLTSFERLKRAGRWRRGGNEIARSLFVDYDRCARQCSGPSSPQHADVAREDLFARLYQFIGDRFPIRGALIRDPVGQSLCQHLGG